MKAQKLLLAVICIATCNCSAQTPGEWTWMHGDNTPNSLGVFGTQGVASPTNKPPALYEACEWKDKNGNFWLFGGVANGNEHSTLWKYDPDPSNSTYNQWTWMKGPSAPNQPGIYGTQSVPSPANYPGARAWGITTWSDTSGNLWLFGGGDNINVFNDLWKYDPNPASPTYNQWTWMKGPSIANDPGSYGTKGVSNSANLPPSRCETSCSWTDNAGNLWLYGGNRGGMFGDLWKYDISINEWTWMHGANTLNPPAVYGTQTVANPNNTPGGRAVYCSWKDLSGNLWLFGGAQTITTTTNDLWKYDPTVPPYGEWTWVSGDNTPNQAAVYGIKGTSASANKPGAKLGSVAWMDNKGYIWVFGGQDAGGYYNDLFRYVPDPACVPVCNFLATVTSTGILCNGKCNGTATANSFGGASPYTYSWSNFQTSQTITGLCPGGYTVTVTDFAGSTATVAVTIAQPTAITTTTSSTQSSCNTNTGTATINASGGTPGYTYNWSNGQTTQAITGLAAGIYTVIVADANGCTQAKSVQVTNANGPIANAWNNATITAGNSIALSSSSNPPFVIYSWSPSTGLSCTTCQNPIATPTVTTVYCVTTTDANNCTDTACVTVTVEPPCPDLYLPNAFSPNNDGENDEFCLQAGIENCIKELTITIYDRWGEKVYESTDKNFCWDGTYKGSRMNSAVFVYYMDATLISENTIAKKGNISLMR